MAQAAFCLRGLPEVDLLASSHSTQFQHYDTFESPLPLGALGLNAFNHPWMFQVSCMFPSPALVPVVLSRFLAEHVNGQLRHLSTIYQVTHPASQFTCHSSFQKGTAQYEYNAEELCLNLYYFFKRSSCRQKDLFEIEESLGLEELIALHLVQS